MPWHQFRSGTSAEQNDKENCSILKENSILKLESTWIESSNEYEFNFERNLSFILNFENPNRLSEIDEASN